ncbi:MAG: TetR/AcrR family transcriptional regulator [Rhizobiaceae bacterium]|jgi:AcrR family transcriptional regulator|nr:TetR/AcrR family transcriptional regulator [Rhizobiaceae bacterium]
MAGKPSFDREDLIERAQALFWKSGWAGTSMKDLEKGLNIRPGSFYAAFGSKDDLYELALDRYAATGQRRLKELTEEFGPIGALKVYLKALASKQSGTPAKACMLVKTLLELQGRNDQLADRADKHLSAMEKGIEKLFRDAQEKGEIDPSHDPAKLARRFQSDMVGLRATAERKSVDANALAEEMITALDRL